VLLLFHHSKGCSVDCQTKTGSKTQDCGGRFHGPENDQVEKEGVVTSIRPRIGIVTTGQGPREEYDLLHASVLEQLGVEIDVVSRHVLDGLGPQELRNLEPFDGVAAIHANVRSDVSDVTTLGSGWRNVWLDRDKFVDRVQIALESLEGEGVCAAIVCVAEELPEDRLHFSQSLLVPFRLLRGALESAIRSRREARVVVFSYGTRQRAQQEEAWSREDWMRDATIEFVELDQGWAAAGALAAKSSPDFGLIMGYGAGLLGERDGLQALREQIGAPIIVPHMLAATAVRHFVQPALNPRVYLDDRVPRVR
jgi:protein AroM